MAARHHVGRLIREARTRAGMKQADLASRIDKSVPSLSGIERGVFNPSLETLEAIADALRAPLAALFPASLNPGKETAREKLAAEVAAELHFLSLEDLETLALVTRALRERDPKRTKGRK